MFSTAKYLFPFRQISSKSQVIEYNLLAAWTLRANVPWRPGRPSGWLSVRTIGGFQRPFRGINLARELVPQDGAKCTKQQNSDWIKLTTIARWSSWVKSYLIMGLLRVEGNLRSTPKLSWRPTARNEAVSLPDPAKISMANIWWSGCLLDSCDSLPRGVTREKGGALTASCHWCACRLWGFSQPGSAHKWIPRLQRSPGFAAMHPVSKLYISPAKSLALCGLQILVDEGSRDIRASALAPLVPLSFAFAFLWRRRCCPSGGRSGSTWLGFWLWIGCLGWHRQRQQVKTYGRMCKNVL